MATIMELLAIPGFDSCDGLARLRDASKARMEEARRQIARAYKPMWDDYYRKRLGEERARKPDEYGGM